MGEENGGRGERECNFLVVNCNTGMIFRSSRCLILKNENALSNVRIVSIFISYSMFNGNKSFRCTMDLTVGTEDEYGRYFWNFGAL